MKQLAMETACVLQCHVQSLNDVMHSIDDEVRYRLLRYLEEHPQASQRELALHLGVSLGKINYCLRALIEKGLVKMRNFRRSESKLAYLYILTPKGIDEKVNVTVRCLQRKMLEYEALSEEIRRLSREVRGSVPDVETDVKA